MHTRDTQAAYLHNPWLRWFWEHGGEEPVGPDGAWNSLLGGPYPQPWTQGPSHEPWRRGPFPHPWRNGGPLPDPWRAAVGQLIRAAQVRDLAAKLPEGRLRGELDRSARLAIEAILDEWCGTPPRRHWPWPGPPPWIWDIASELSLTANSLQPGSLRDGIEQLATEALEKAAGGFA